ncbi:hypothetical protein [Streptomyces omiyaensis]|uniref:Alkaline shock response membrane anchor protein AmaP n=1 Tax=Streptomyces omiyaensis TaxID=68247 RepID=A0ABW7BRH0_9ACTN|nr:hypothetical protein [Streptomyces omiyaensis]GGY38493.1 hypothetical protein GCM10010363_19110 [Streptomyces omiyaensis]
MRSRTVANRTALALTGLALLASGAAATRWGEERILTAALRHLEPTDHRLLLAASSAALAASLVLLTAQIRRPGRRRLNLPAPGCQLDSRAVRHAVRTGCAAVPGVVRARCSLTGRRGTMRLAITLTVNGTAHPGEVLTAVADGVLPQITPLLTPRRLHTRIRLRVQRPRPHRTQ